MIYLVGTTHTLQVVTGQAVTIDVQADYIDATAANPPVVQGLTSGPQNTNITTAATSTVVSAPLAGIIRTVKTLTIRNIHASAPCDVTVRHNMNGVIVEMKKVTLVAQAELHYIEGVGFYVLPSAQANPLITSAEESSTQRVLENTTLSPIAPGVFTWISGTAYFIYMGRMARDTLIAFVEFQLTTLATGAQTAEVGLFSSLSAPNKTAQLLTKLVATGTVDSLTVGLAAKRNTTTFNQLVPAGTHLWAAARSAMATLQPITTGVANDMSQGNVLATTGGGALTGLSQTSGQFIPAITTNLVAPKLRVTLD